MMRAKTAWEEQQRAAALQAEKDEAARMRGGHSKVLLEYEDRLVVAEQRIQKLEEENRAALESVAQGLSRESQHLAVLSALSEGCKVTHEGATPGEYTVLAVDNVGGSGKWSVRADELRAFIIKGIKG